jgi:hypothetical protein
MMVVVKFMARQRDHLVLTLVCAIQFTLGTTCLTVNVSNFLTTLFRQLFTLALVSLTIHVTCFLLPIKMQKRPSISTRSIFRRNLHSSLNCPPTNIRCNLRIAMRNSLSCPSAGICRNLRITAHRLASVTICASLRVAL